jgi:hypothetical protein
VEASIQQVTAERTVSHDPTEQSSSTSPSLTLFTSSGIDKSYIFHVEKAERRRAQQRQEEVFREQRGWGFRTPQRLRQVFRGDCNV